MIAKINTGSYVKGMVKYNQDKTIDNEAKLIGISNIKDDKFQTIVNAIAKSNERNKKISKPNLHISISFHKKDNLKDYEMYHIAEKYMDSMGYGDQPFAVYRHYDRPHPHFHIVSSAIDIEGNKISDSHNYFKNHRICRKLEQEYQLVDATKTKEIHLTEDLKENVHAYLESSEEVSLAPLLRRIMEEVMQQKPTTFKKLDYYLKEYNVRRSENEQGHYFSILNYEDFDNFNKTANAIGGAKLDKDYSFENLKNQLELYQREKQQLLKNMMGRVYAVINQKQVLTLSEFIIAMHKKGIAVEIKRAQQGATIGAIYGMLFIDKKTGHQYSASDLKIKTKKDLLSFIKDDKSDLEQATKSRDYQKIARKQQNNYSDNLERTPIEVPLSIIDHIDNTLNRLLAHQNITTANTTQIQSLAEKKKKRRRRKKQ